MIALSFSVHYSSTNLQKLIVKPAYIEQLKITIKEISLSISPLVPYMFKYIDEWFAFNVKMKQMIYDLQLKENLRD